MLAGAVLALTACSAHGIGSTPSLPVTSGGVHPTKASSAATLYVADGAYSVDSKPKVTSVTLFPADSTLANPKSIGTLTPGTAGAYGLTFDKHGNLFVANLTNVMGFKPGAKKPFLTLTKGVLSPDAVTVGSDGTVYVADVVGFGTGPGSVEVFPPGRTIATHTYVDPSFWNVTDVAVDAKKNLYIAYCSQSSNSANAAYAANVDLVEAGSTKLKHLNLSIFPGVNSLIYGITIDGKGNLVLAVTNLTIGSYILVFPPGAKKAARTIGPFSAYFGKVAFSRDYSRLFVGVDGTGAYAIDYATGDLVSTFKTKLPTFTIGVAVWPGAQ
jgi:hypothetical protein